MKWISSRGRVCLWLFVLVLLGGCVITPSMSQLEDEPQSISAELGTVDFPISCNAEAQAEFTHGVTLLHSFFFPRAIASFEKVVELDPSCAMGYWGQAMTHLNIPWSPTLPENVIAGTAAVEAAMAAGAPTEREQGYINAAAQLYKDADAVAFRDRIAAYEVAMAQLVQDFPDDIEAQAFYSLALNMTGLPAAEGFPKQLKATEVAEPIFAAYPNHPGAAHYLIHSHDFPPLAEGGLEAALVYAKIAPDAPHAQHMPSHIFTRLGYWQESIDSNTVGAAAYKAATGEINLHATDYMMYAHLQLGQDEAVLTFIDEINSIEQVSGNFGNAYALAAMPARYVMERGAWNEGVTLTLHPSSFPWENFPQAEAIMVAARGVSTARAGDVDAARGDLARLQEVQGAMNEANRGYWAGRADIQIGAVTAWIALAEGNGDEALAAMRTAAELDAASTMHPVSPGNVFPAYELLGEMLLDLDQPAEALAAFETSMEGAPNRFRSFYGAARAAELAGDADTAQAYYEELVHLAANADGERAELIQARAFLSAGSMSIEDKIANAMSAGPAAIAQEATILDLPEGFPGNWPDEPVEGEMIELRAGTNGWTCIVDRPNTPGNDPMCLNETYLEVIKAQLSLTDSPSSGIGIGYMLQEGSPVGSPPHMMFFAPGSNDSLSAFSTEPGPAPWVMFADTTHAHLMLTQVPRPESVAASEDKIASAVSAGPAAIAQDATIWEYPEGYKGNWPDEPIAKEPIELRAGSNGWTCIADFPDTPGNDPMCLNETYVEVLKARFALVDSPSSGIGIGYMLQEGSPAGTPPHMMVFVPGSNDGLAAFTTEPGPAPWVMFPDTSHAHLMLTFFY